MENVLVKNTNPSERCQALIDNKTRQCIYEKVPGSNNCLIHGGIHAAKRIEEQKVRNYRLQKYQQRVNEFADADGVKSLREEIGILRMVLEEILNKCRDPEDLLLYSSKIADYVLKIEKVVVSCHRLENSLGYLMDKTTILNISDQIVNVIGLHIQDESVLNEIIDGIITMLDDPMLKIGNKELLDKDILK